MVSGGLREASEISLVMPLGAPIPPSPNVVGIRRPGVCYLEFGNDQVGRVEVTFRSGERPSGQSDDPSELYAADKAEFGTSRIRRWFGRDWTAYPATDRR